MVYSGEYRKAIDLYNEKFKSEEPGYRVSFYLSLLGVASCKTGDSVSAAKYLNELLIRSEGSPAGSPSFCAAAVYAAMNEKDKAFELLEKSSVNREVEIYWLKVDPLFQTLHDDPRFKKLLRKVGF